MGDKKKTTGDLEQLHTNDAGTNAMNDAEFDGASTGAVLPDPEEIKLGPLHKPKAEHRTIIDVNKPSDTNEDDEDHASWDFRRNK